MKEKKYKKQDEFLFELNKERKTYTFNEMLERVREKKGLNPLQVKIKTDIPEKELIEIEQGKKPILKEELKLLLELYKLPKRWINLADDARPPLAKNLTDLRMKNNKTQYEFCKTLNIAQTTYASYETGKREPDIKTLIQIANHYKVTIDYLVGRTNTLT